MVKSRYRKSVPTPLLHYFLLTILFFRFQFSATAKKTAPYMKGDDKNYYDHYFGDSIYLYAGDHRAINGHGHRGRISAIWRPIGWWIFYLSYNKEMVKKTRKILVRGSL